MSKARQNIKKTEIAYEREIELKIQALPEDLRKEVLDFIEFLLGKYKSGRGKIRKLKFDWEGGLSEIGKQYTSVELQHKALTWR